MKQKAQIENLHLLILLQIKLKWNQSNNYKKFVLNYWMFLKGVYEMGEAIVITSGKGGVGKSTTTANIGTALALLGQKVCLIDTDIVLRNLDVVMGLENRINFDIVNVIEERCQLNQ